VWTCPECGREFSKPKQWHSCLRQTVDAHFERRAPEVRTLFDTLLENVERIGPVRVVAVKSQINLAARANFAGIKPLADGLRVGFMSDAPLVDPRIEKTEAVSLRSYAHAVVVRGPEELDPQLLGWLAEAYRLKS
jgi:Domain of unknown function (DUF5655)